MLIDCPVIDVFDFGEAPDILSQVLKGARIYLLHQRDYLVTKIIAGILIQLVAAVFDPGQPRLEGKLLQDRPPGEQQGANNNTLAGQDPTETAYPRPFKKIHEQGFDIVIEMMGREDKTTLPTGYNLVKPIITQLPRRYLDG